MEGKEDRVEESVAPIVPEDKVNADDEFRPSVQDSSVSLGRTRAF